jgi:uncharacterized protein
VNERVQDSISPVDRFLVRWLILPLHKVYRAVFSPALAFFGSRCRFYPSCSIYSVEAFKTHGVFRGFWLSAIRVAKCNPLHPGGVDPVPPARRHHHCKHDHSGTQPSDAVS